MKPSSSLQILPFLSLSALTAASWTPPDSYAIVPSPDGHFFQTTDGQPFFWQADTAWLLFHRLNYTEADIYLSDRAAKGFTVVLAVGFTQIGITSPNRNGDVTFIDEDPTRPNEPYWAYIDSIVSLAWSKGIRIAMVPAWGQYTHASDDTGSVLNSSTSYPFGHFIGQRYPYLPKILVADTNPYWTNKTAVKANYTAGGVTPTYKYTDWGPLYDDLAYGIVDGERAALSPPGKPSSPNHRPGHPWWPLMTIHPTNQWFLGGPLALASAFFDNRDWLAFDASQSGHADFPPNPPIPWWNCRRGWEPMEHMYAYGTSGPGKRRPAVDNEAHYEARYDNGNKAYPYWNASDVRVGSWQTVFSGGAGLTYGADNVMQFYIPGLFTQDGSGPARSWEVDIGLPGSGQMQYIKKAIFDRGNATYFTRIPAQDIVVSNAGTNDQRVTACRDSRGGWIMVYSPLSNTFSIETKSLKSCNVNASWYDPTVGTYSAFSYAQCGKSSTVEAFTPPTSSNHTDWLLVLEAH